MHKREGNAEYAVKIFTGRELGPAFTHEVLSELKALFKARAALRVGLARPADAPCRAGEEGLAGV